MKLYVSLLINGAEDGPRIPVHMHLAGARTSQAILNVRLSKTIEVGPARFRGEAALGFFTTKASDDGEDDLILEVGFGPISEGQTIIYRPD